jgi:hypothetical protein
MNARRKADLDLSLECIRLALGAVQVRRLGP